MWKWRKGNTLVLQVLGTALTCPQWGPDFHFVFLLYFPDYLPAPKMFSLQYFLNSFSFCVVSSSCSCDFFFFSSPHNALFLKSNLQLLKVNSDLALRTYSKASLHQPGIRPTALLTCAQPSPDRHFYMFSSPFAISSSHLSNHGNHKSHFNPRPTSSPSFQVPSLMAPFPLFCL